MSASRIRRIGFVAFGLLLISGCEKTADALSTRSGNYVFQATSVSSPSSAPSPYWGDHLTRPGDTFPAIIGSDGRFSISGLRVSGYSTPGAAMTAGNSRWTGGTTHLTTAGSDPAFFTTSGGFSATDSININDNALLSGSIATTATRTSPATVLADTVTFNLRQRPSLSGTGAGRYRFTTTAVTSDPAVLPLLVAPVQSTADILLSNDGTTTVNVDPTSSANESVATFLIDPDTLVGQYSSFNDSDPLQIRSFPITMDLSGIGAARVVSAAAWTVLRRNTTTTTLQEEDYDFSVKPLSFFLTFNAAVFEIFDGNTIVPTQVPATWQSFVNRVDTAVDADQTVLADIFGTSVVTTSGTELTNVEMRLDTETAFGTLDTSDLRIPIGEAGGNKLVYAYREMTPSDGSIHQGLVTTITFEFNYTGTTLSSGSLTFASTGGTATQTFTINAKE
ncbi:MAG: hypothetical protein H0W72_04675 [Planctomycetes bacterium]|nr:hypothetical protein [Planctomycetota bacterium]